MGALDKLEGFLSLNGAAHYGPCRPVPCPNRPWLDDTEAPMAREPALELLVHGAELLVHCSRLFCTVVGSAGDSEKTTLQIQKR